MNTTSKAGNWKKSPGIAGNGPQIDEAGKMSKTTSRKSKVAPEVAKRRFLTVLRRV